MSFLKTNDSPVSNEFLNEHGQITEKSLLKKDRVKFGIGNIMYQSEEVGLGPIHTVVIRALGGEAQHIGMVGALGSIGSVFQWIGTVLLKKFNSNRKAMVFALSLGVIFSLITAFFIMLPVFNDNLKLISIWGYLIFSLGLAAASGVQWNIETSWIGDLVPKQILGWFTSFKWVIAVFGILCFMMAFGKVSDMRPKLSTYVGLYVVVGISHVIAILLMRTVTDRTPKNANFISSGSSHHERLNYKALPLWTYLSFYLLWAGGRTAMLAFVTAYLLDAFQYSMTKIAGLLAMQSVVSMAVLLLMGKITDKRGHRIPLVVVSGFVGSCMFLWVASAWFGIIPIIIYNILNGAAGHTHSMLATNYGLEIFPDKGRSGYLAFSRIFIGLAGMITSVIGGFFVRSIQGWETVLMGARFTHYHVYFTICSLITISCIIPLLIAGNRSVKDE